MAPAADCCAVLKAPKTTNLDPHPIAPADFAKVRAAAEGARGRPRSADKLNLCFYPIDLALVRWKEIDLDRGLPRQAGQDEGGLVRMLWSRTIDILRTLTRSNTGDYMFD